MHKITHYYILFFLITLVFSIVILSCEKEENIPPECIILNPKSNSKIVIGKSINISVLAKSDNDKILEVIFFIDDKEVETLKAQPYKFYWETENYDVGVHKIKAVAVDNSGLSSEYEINMEIIQYSPPTPVTDVRDGNTYEVVEIGKQVWMAENLRYKNEYTVYVNNDDDNTEVYGYLYMTHIGSGEGVCPDEWHIPSRNDWFELIEYLGGSGVAGGKLKETGTQRWELPNQGATNSSGFTALPAGSLSWEHLPEAFGNSARFFTSFYGNYIFLDFDTDDVTVKAYHPSNEFYSIRCIRDY
jgi:uncharacterized protein (TIGR02145 family)